MKTIALFNNKGGVGKTSLVYHLAWMYADLGLSVIAADLDPQANLSSMFLDEERLEALWPDGKHVQTIYGAVQPLLEGTGDVAAPHVEDIAENLGLLVGDLTLSASEDELSSQWPGCLDRQPRAFRVLSAFWRVLEEAAREREAAVVLIDVGPNLGAINRGVMIAAEHVVIPLAPDLYSLQGLKNLGPTLRRWREEWKERRDRNPVRELSVPKGAMSPSGYVVMQHAVYTRYAKVLDAEGKALTVREALALINQTLDEALAEQEGDFDAESRWALTWFEQSGFAEGEYGVAEQLSKSKNTSVDGMREAGIVASKGGKVRLLKPDELREDWDPSGDSRLTVWEVVHQLIRGLGSGGETAGAELVAKLGAKAETARELAYRLFTLCERKKRAADALAYNGLVQSWPEIVRLAREGPATAGPAEPGLFDQEDR